jgi:acyl-CoA hydrolase
MTSRAAARLVDSLAPGLRVFVQGMSGESTLLREELAADPERARGVIFDGAQFPGVDRTDYLGVHPEARLRAYFMSPALRAALPSGRAELYALDYPGIVRHFADGPPPDVAIAQLSLPDADGLCSLGLSADFLPLVWPRAKKRIAHLNPRLPHTRGVFRVHVSEIDVAVEADRPVLQFPDPKVGDVEARIGEHVATLVRDGDTLQLGIGSVPSAVASVLRSHRKLRFFSGMITAPARTLWESGALDRDARITSGVLLGDDAFYAFAAGLEQLWLTHAGHTHDVTSIAAIPRFVGVNGAVEVDLFGQVNAERVDGTIQAGSGGAPVFARGAQGSAGGRFLVCLGATARKGTVSRIVPALGTNALVTVPRYLSDAIVTEHGVAELRGLTLDARARAIIAIAAPEHRDSLGNAWDEMRKKM